MRTLLLLLALLSTPALAQTALLVDGPDGLSIEAIEDDLTPAQQQAVDEGRATVVGRIGADGWCLGCSADLAEARRDHEAQMDEHRSRMETHRSRMSEHASRLEEHRSQLERHRATMARARDRFARAAEVIDTDEAFRVVVGDRFTRDGSLRADPTSEPDGRVRYEVSLVLRGEVLLDDADLSVIADEPALDGLSVVADATAATQSTRVEARFVLDDETSLAPATAAALHSLRERAQSSVIEIDLR